MQNVRLAVIVLSLAAGVPSISAESCVILKRMGPADEVTSHLYSFGLKGKQFQYVEGEFPQGVKFHGRLTDADVRQIQEHGGKIVVVEPKYTPIDLQQAREGCKPQTTDAAKPSGAPAGSGK